MTLRDPSKELLCAVIKNRGCAHLVDKCFDTSYYEMDCRDCPVSFYSMGIISKTGYFTAEQRQEKLNRAVSYFIERHGVEALFEGLL